MVKLNEISIHDSVVIIHPITKKKMTVKVMSLSPGPNETMDSVQVSLERGTSVFKRVQDIVEVISHSI